MFKDDLLVLEQVRAWGVEKRVCNSTRFLAADIEAACKVSVMP